MALSAVAQQFNQQRTSAAFTALVQQSPVEAGAWVRAMSTRAALPPALVQQVNDTFANPALTPADRAAQLAAALGGHLANLTSMIDTANAQRAGAVTLGWQAGTPAPKVYVGQMSKDAAGLLEVTVGNETLKVAVSSGQFRVGDIATMVGFTLSMKGEIVDNNGVKTLRVDEWCPEAQTDFVSGRVAVAPDGKVNINTGVGTRVVEIADPTLAATLANWASVGFCIPGTVEERDTPEGKRWVLTSPTPEAVHMLTSLEGAQPDPNTPGVTIYRSSRTPGNNSTYIFGPDANTNTYIRRFVKGSIVTPPEAGFTRAFKMVQAWASCDNNGAAPMLAAPPAPVAPIEFTPVPEVTA